VVAVQRALDAAAAGRSRTDRVTKWIALVDQTIDQAEVSAESQRKGNIARALTANVNGAAPDRRADDLARGYGLVPCVQATTAPPTSTTTTTKAGA
jgi:hypothetical protein